jgi:hypothetical protein
LPAATVFLEWDPQEFATSSSLSPFSPAFPFEMVHEPPIDRMELLDQGQGADRVSRPSEEALGDLKRLPRLLEAQSRPPLAVFS